ncbi:helix-turn-helix domain-containing protein [Paenisporosarcina sp. OV554]|uniref:helix-turn-helix domain-containing protein n=1 Tax=Paenisporosarcina sp. OV554 TaxID=2135694 RepID=UPI000D46CE21|nr:helix-turn-helix transcriptional regulator [Paenisporosarcina sp. OV554]PUB17950.1 DNA-binding XRE family transcriptional regulator [Paenisporosarcina sp. OV554]
MDNIEIGNRLLKLREDKGLHQHQVGEAVGVSKPSIGAYERGERTPRDGVKVKLAEFYKVDLVDLFYR